MMQSFTVRKQMSDEEAQHLAGTLLTDRDYDLLIREDAIVYKEDGTPLLIYKTGAIGLNDCKNAFQHLKQVTKEGDGASNRGMATGNFRVIGGEGFGIISGGGTGNRVRLFKKDGTLSKTNYTLSSEIVIKRIKEYGGRVEQQLSDGSWIEIEPEVKESGVVGYMDASRRFPYCRLTAFNINHPEKFRQSMPLIHAVDQTFHDLAPERYQAQLEMVQKTEPGYVITGTAFTTITVNMNFQTAVHQDKGDYKNGFGVMAALRRGKYNGCFTCFPQYRVAVDMQTGDVCLADVHEWHGNTPLYPAGRYERLALIFYYREKMHECGTTTEEIEKAKRYGRGKL